MENMNGSSIPPNFLSGNKVRSFSCSQLSKSDKNSNIIEELRASLEYQKDSDRVNNEKIGKDKDVGDNHMYKHDNDNDTCSNSSSNGNKPTSKVNVNENKNENENAYATSTSNNNHIFEGITPNMMNDLVTLDLTYGFRNLQNVLFQIFDAIKKQSTNLDSLTLKVNNVTTKIEDYELDNKDHQDDIKEIKEKLGLLCTEEEMFNLHYEMDRKNAEMNQKLSQMKDDAFAIHEDLDTLNNEIIQLSLKGTDADSKLEKVKEEMSIADSLLDKKLYALDQDLNSHTAECSEFISKDEMLEKIDHEKAISDENLRQVESRLERKLKNADDEIIHIIEDREKKLKDEVKNKVSTVEFSLTKLAQGIDSLKLPERRKQLQAVAKDCNRLHGHIKELTDNHESDVCMIKELIERKTRAIMDNREEMLDNIYKSLPTPISGNQKIEENSENSAEILTSVEAVQQELVRSRGQQRQILDMRTDISDIATLVDALTKQLRSLKEETKNKHLGPPSAGVNNGTPDRDKIHERTIRSSPRSVSKMIESQRAEIMGVLNAHASQLSHLLSSKADLSSIEQLLSEKDIRSLSSDELDSARMELESIRSILETKASRDELRSLRKAVQQNIAEDHPKVSFVDQMDGVESAIARVQLKCVACDRALSRISGEDPISPGAHYSHTMERSRSPPPMNTQALGYFDLGPNVAFRRWQVKDLLRASRGEIPMPSTNPPGKRSSSQLPPIPDNMYQQRPWTAPAPGKVLNDGKRNMSEVSINGDNLDII